MYRRLEILTVTNFKAVPLFKVGEETEKINKYYDDKNEIFIEGRTEQVFKLTTDNLRNTEVILVATEIENVRLPNAIVKINVKGEFLTTVINSNAINKHANFSKLELEPSENLSINNLNSDSNSCQVQYDRDLLAQEQRRLEQLDSEEKELTTNLCLEFSDVFYLEGDTLVSPIKLKIQ